MILWSLCLSAWLSGEGEKERSEEKERESDGNTRTHWSLSRWRKGFVSSAQFQLLTHIWASKSVGKFTVVVQIVLDYTGLSKQPEKPFVLYLVFLLLFILLLWLNYSSQSLCVILQAHDSRWSIVHMQTKRGKMHFQETWVLSSL